VLHQNAGGSVASQAAKNKSMWYNESMAVPSWHALPVTDVLAGLGSSPAGMSADGVAARRSQTKKNILVTRKGPSSLFVFLQQFKSPLISLLAVAAIVSLALGHTRDAVIISVILLFNALIGFSQERRAAAAMKALKSLTRNTCKVIRGGDEIEIVTDDVLPGDVLSLAAGDIVSADARVIESANLKVDEAVLTGEASAARKIIDPLPENTVLPDRSNSVFRGTTVVSGRGLAVVTAIGMDTEFGRIVATVQDIHQDETPLQQRFRVFARGIGFAVISFVVLIFLLGIFRGEAIAEMSLVAISLAVAVVPEGLPIVVTLTLALGTRQMAKRKAIVRKLAAVETLGSVDLIAADKTGTLTYGEMMVREVHTLEHRYEVSGQGYQLTGGMTRDGHAVSLVDDSVLEQALLVGALCNDAHLMRRDGAMKPVGDPTEIALVVLAEKAGLKPAELRETHPRIGEFPFDFTARSMVTFHTRGTREFVAVKGAPEAILELAGSVNRGGKIEPLTSAMRLQLREAADDLAARGLRALALASVESETSHRGADVKALRGHLVYLGMVGIQDSVRPEAKETIARCHEAGIRVVMVTGDHQKTAEHVARELGLISGSEPEALIDGAVMDQLSDEALAKRLPLLRVAARTSPLQKLRLVRAMKNAGHVVAVTGDGVNDAPALIEAHIGVAVDQHATDAAKEAADILLTDGNLATIVDAVEVGRGIFQNLRRVVLYLFSTNVVEAVLLFASLLAGLPLPFLPIQILWLNVISDTFLDVAISMEPVHASVMDRPPRSLKENILNRPTILRLAFLSAINIGGTFLFLRAVADSAVSTELRYALGFTMLIAFQWFNAVNVLTERQSVLKRPIGTNPWFILALMFVISLHLLILYVPAFNTVFHFAPLAPLQLLTIFLISTSVFWLEEIRKWVFRRIATQRA
jgi:Ca2+-transporting ATPase